ncbi:hypothetical protein IWQ61_001894 [Dispira simplex]|nr:hypothetical protein IWQ61_001894 [Dispira simplex]
MTDSPKHPATSNSAGGTQANRAFKTYHEVIEEAKVRVDNLEPFLKGHMASSAFCLLFKFWTLRLTVKQVNGLLKNPDSP